MKKVLPIFVIVLALFIFANIATAKTTPQINTETKSQPTDSFQTSKAWNKLDSRLQQAWIQYQKDGDGGVMLQCFLVATEMVSSVDQDYLLKNGYITQVVTGTIARGRMLVKNIPTVANLWLVRQIKLATK